MQLCESGIGAREELEHQSQHLVFGRLQVAEVKQFDDELSMIVLLEQGQLPDTIFGVLLLS